MKKKAILRKLNITCFFSHAKSKFKSACAYVVAGVGECGKLALKEEEVPRQKKKGKRPGNEMCVLETERYVGPASGESREEGLGSRCV